ncbi:apolipoprotein N-acyltransferase [Patescibacteria group bacterium]|jgi:apolipoprotein N-acyltransferase|nr:apolipoprotein N-acyltransferase [Patescibacteria group bacterium]
MAHPVDYVLRTLRARLREPRTYLILGSIYGIWIVHPLATLNGWWWLESGGVLWQLRHALIYLFVWGWLGVGMVGVPLYLFAHLARRVSTRSVPGDMLVLGLAWMGIEVIREFLVYGFTWAHLGYLTAPSLALMQHASWGGVYALSALLMAVCVGGVRALLWRQWRRLSYPCALAALAWGSGALLLTTYTPPEPPATLAALHTGLSTRETTRFSGAETTLTQLEEALAAGAEVVLLPENSFPMFELNKNLALRGDPTEGRVPALFARLTALSRAHPDSSIVVGLHIHAPEATYNALLSLAGGEFTSVYRKRVLMPFGEVVPPFLERKHTGTFETGARAQEFAAGGVAATPLLCSEVIYPRLAATPPTPLLLNASNDSLFSHPGVSRTNSTQARFRAVENRAWLVRSVKGGISSIIAPTGAVAARSSAPDTAEVLMVSGAES